MEKRNKSSKSRKFVRRCFGKRVTQRITETKHPGKAKAEKVDSQTSTAPQPALILHKFDGRMVSHSQLQGMRVAPRDGHPRVAATSSGNAGRTTKDGIIYYKDDEEEEDGRSSKYTLMDKTKERKADKEVRVWGRVFFAAWEVLWQNHHAAWQRTAPRPI
jgi:hypothetical protein